jgi:hypothetical protein
VLIGVGSALFQVFEQQKAGQEQQRTAQSQFFQQQKAAHDLLISNQVSKGFEQLAGEKIEMRLGGIYALEGVMNDQTSPQYHQPGVSRERRSAKATRHPAPHSNPHAPPA